MRLLMSTDLISLSFVPSHFLTESQTSQATVSFPLKKEEKLIAEFILSEAK